MEGLKPCPLCGSTNVTCFAEYDGESYDSGPLYRAVVGCLRCREEGCDPSYDEEPCFGIEAYFPGSHPLLKDCEDPSDCERALERHMTERWNRRAGSACKQRCAERTCRYVRDHMGVAGNWFCKCSECGAEFDERVVDRHFVYCPECGARVVDE